MEKTQIKSIIVMAVLTLGMLITGSFLDLEVSNALYRGSESFVAVLGGFAGKLPAFLLLAFAFAVLLSYVKSHKDAYKSGVRVTLYIVYCLAIVLSFLLAFYSAFEEITGKAKYIAVLMTLVASIITIVLVFKKDMAHIEELKKWALLTILAIGIIMVIVVLLKEVWGRYRYSTVIGEGSPFTPWYTPNGPGGGHSLPSGHTALWGTLFLLIPLMNIYNIKGEGAMYFGIILTQLFVGIFRIIGGHHYLTDVTISMIITFTVTTVVTAVGYRKGVYTLSDNSLFNRI